MYNMLFGVNPHSPLLLSMLDLCHHKLNPKGKYDIGRFRDIYPTEAGTKITVYTRNGGGNRECWDEEGCVDGKHGENCMVTIIANLRKHPDYMSDHDDDIDCTYAYFEFNVPRIFRKITKTLFDEQGEPSTISEKFDKITAEMQTMSKEQLESDPRFGQLAKLAKRMVEQIEESPE